MCAAFGVTVPSALVNDVLITPQCQSAGKPLVPPRPLPVWKFWYPGAVWLVAAAWPVESTVNADPPCTVVPPKPGRIDICAAFGVPVPSALVNDALITPQW